METQKGISRKCDICSIDVYRFVKHFTSKKHFEKIKQEDMNIPEWLIGEHIEKNIE